MGGNVGPTSPVLDSASDVVSAPDVEPFDVVAVSVSAEVEPAPPSVDEASLSSPQAAHAMSDERRRRRSSMRGRMAP
jgi:hypothetical protein